MKNPHESNSWEVRTRDYRGHETKQIVIADTFEQVTAAISAQLAATSPATQPALVGILLLQKVTVLP